MILIKVLRGSIGSRPTQNANARGEDDLRLSIPAVPGCQDQALGTAAPCSNIPDGNYYYYCYYDYYYYFFL